MKKSKPKVCVIVYEFISELYLVLGVFFDQYASNFDK